MADDQNPLTLDPSGFNPALGLEAAAEWWKKGGLARSLGLPTVGEQMEAAESKQNALQASGAPLGELVKAGMDNPLLYAFGPSSIRGWHGTPHTFQAEEGAPLGRFRDEAIGSGEGAQAYGYGHYVAGNPAVARSYKPRDTLFAGPTFKGNTVDDYHQTMQKTSEEMNDIWPRDARIALTQANGDPDKAIAIVNSWEKPERDASTKQWIEDNRQHLGYKEPPGSLLEVHILPEESELLDWDKPLSEQSPGVQKALEKYDPPSDFKGSDIYDWLSRGFTLASRRVTSDMTPNFRKAQMSSQQEASAALHEAGIPGIRYLDAGSRVAGEGTHNYVIFNPSNLRIIGRNGERLEPVEGNPFKD